MCYWIKAKDVNISFDNYTCIIIKHLMIRHFKILQVLDFHNNLYRKDISYHFYEKVKLIHKSLPEAPRIDGR